MQSNLQQCLFTLDLRDPVLRGVRSQERGGPGGCEGNAVAEGESGHDFTSV